MHGATVLEEAWRYRSTDRCSQGQSLPELQPSTRAGAVSVCAFCQDLHFQISIVAFALERVMMSGCMVTFVAPVAAQMWMEAQVVRVGPALAVRALDAQALAGLAFVG